MTAILVLCFSLPIYLGCLAAIRRGVGPLQEINVPLARVEAWGQGYRDGVSAATGCKVTAVEL